MEWIELIELTDKIVRLRYYPEQRTATGEFGEVTYFRKTGEQRFDKVAKVGGFGIEYALHACASARYIDKFNDGKFKKMWSVGWY